MQVLNYGTMWNRKKKNLLGLISPKLIWEMEGYSWLWIVIIHTRMYLSHIQDQSSSGKTWHTSPKSMVPDILTTIKWWDLVGLPTLKPRISYWLWQIRMIFPWHGTPNKIHTINPSFVGGYDSWFYPLCILIIHPFYPHIHMISPGFVWKFGTPIFFFHGESLWTPHHAILGPFGAPKRGCGYIPMYPLPQHGWKIARACRWASQLETSSGGIFQLAMVEYRRVSPLYPDIIRYPHYIPINPSHIPFWLWRILELHVFAQGSMTGVLEGCQSVIHLAADGRRVARKNHGDGAVTRSNHQK